ncbi:hypothetical protein DFH06DRAFT_1247481 [Mycena polygramma]|nr:hypothetical protein DFH06DRAFT_1247481 [Mycena polygramma]
MAEFCLNNIGEDVLLRMFTRTDVSTVLALSQVSRYFHAVASTKQLWLSLIKSLSMRSLIDAPPQDTLINFSIDELIGEVKRTVVGPRTWSIHSPEAPTLLRQFTISMEPDNATLRRSLSISELLPGGRYIVLITQDRLRHSTLECWDVATARCVWTWAVPNTMISLAKYDMYQPSKMTVFLTCKRSDQLGQRDVDLWIHDVDLESGHAHQLLSLASAPVPVLSLVSSQIAGDYFGYDFTTRSSHIATLIGNWRTQEYIIIQGLRTGLNTPGFSFLPGYILLSSASPPSVRLYSLVSLQRLWRPLSDLDLVHPILELEITPTIVLPVLSTVHAVQPILVTRVTVFVNESPLHSDTHVLRVQRTDAESHGTRTISIYHISPCPSRGTLQCTLRSTFVESYALGESSAAGYGLDPGPDVVHIIYGIGRKAYKGKALPMDGTVRVGLSRNGGLLALYDSRAVVSYYL